MKDLMRRHDMLFELPVLHCGCLSNFDFAFNLGNFIYTSKQLLFYLSPIIAIIVLINLNF